MQFTEYEQFVGAETIERVLQKAKPLTGRQVVHISSTYYGGGVAAMLHPLTLLMNDVGLRTEWRIIQGNPDFFAFTKGVHNAIQGAEIDLTEHAKWVYEQVNRDNATRNHLHQDFVIIHDPQPLPLINSYPRSVPWIWRCHIDLTSPNTALWDYLRTFIDQYNAVIVSIPEYTQKIQPPQFYFMPAIDPFSMTNVPLGEEHIDKLLANAGIPTDKPLVAQVSRFDRWKDPQGVIDAFRIARREVDCTLVLLGAPATDDPEGSAIYESLLSQQDERLLIIHREDSLLVNAVQRRAAVVLQKSIREGFGLTVTEALWKGTPVIGGNVGGIRYQIRDGLNGYLVSSVPEAAGRLVQLMKDPALRERLGAAGRETVRRKFLLSRSLEQYLDLLNSFEIAINVRENRELEQAMLTPDSPAEVAPSPEPAMAPAGS